MHHIQRIIHVNPVTQESITKTVVRKVKHTIETLQHFARYAVANTTSVNGRTKSGWKVFIEDVGKL